jgi:methanogenic corrinoid protein MtbC1
VAQAIAQGHRPAQVLSASEQDLDRLLEAGLRQTMPPQSSALAPSASAEGKETAEEVKELLSWVGNLEGERLKRRLHHDWTRLGPLEFLERRVAPLLRAVGDAWAVGALDIRHEHFASSVLGDFLRAARQPLEDRATGPVAALATLPGELHGLGLQMTAVVCALAGWQTLILGVDTPVQQIAALAREAALAAVAISCVQRKNGFAAQLASLRRRLPRHIPLLIGGSGIPASRQPRGSVVFADLPSLDRWLRAQR